MGDSLGGRPSDVTCYDSSGKVDYALVANRDFYKAGIDRLLKARSQGFRLILMCSEAKPENCHRSKLIATSLLALGMDVQHIDEQNRMIDQDELRGRYYGGQLPLLDDMSVPGRSRKRYEPKDDEKSD
jgi:uncharacterized protein (DUF488 family)